MHIRVQICVTNWCIMGYGTDALWNLWDQSGIGKESCPHHIKQQHNTQPSAILWFTPPNESAILMVVLLRYVYNRLGHHAGCWYPGTNYRQVSNIRRTKFQHLKRFSYCLAAVLAESLEARCQVENEDVVGAAPTGDAPTTSEWSTILLPT